MMYEQILVRELPEWLRHLIRKQLSNRLSRPEVEALMKGSLADVDKILGKKKGYEELIPMEKAKFLIKQFCWNEYQSHPDFSDISNIPIAYTEDDEGEPIEVYADLSNFRLYVTLSHKEIKSYDYSSLEELIDKELKSLDFDFLVSDGFNFGKE